MISCIFTGNSFAGHEWPGRVSGTLLLGTKLLLNGEKFWVVWQDCPVGPVEQTILSRAEVHMKRQKPVRFSGRHR